MTTSRTYTIALDAMGGDRAPMDPVAGGVLAARKGIHVLLVGEEEAVRAELSRHDASGVPVQVVPSEGVVSEDEHPAMALRRKPKASIAVCAGLVKEGKADGLVSMGSTGATMAASTLALGLFQGLERPTLGGPFIGLAPRTTIIDLGAHVDARPVHLLNFAALGASFSRFYLGIESPRVGLLSVGAEEGKGNRQVQEAYTLFGGSGLNFVGNVEGHEIFSDRADVVVCDGFVGNVLLKYTEGLAAAAARYLAQALGQDAPAVRQIRGLTQAAERGGGPLFGVNGLAIAGHGRSDAEGIAASVELATRALDARLVETMRDDLARVRANAGAPETGDAQA